MKQEVKNQFPLGWDEARVRDVIEHYENQTEEDAVAEDEAAFANSTMMAVPPPLVAEVRELIARYEERSELTPAPPAERFLELAPAPMVKCTLEQRRRDGRGGQERSDSGAETA